MRIGIVVSSEGALNQAGIRIRYRRIEKHVAAFGHSLSLHVIDSLNKADHLHAADLWVFSKCYDSRSILLAQAMHQLGKKVGADFFDDVFSQKMDSRLTRSRAWIDEISSHLDFGLCSTPSMAITLIDLLPDIPVHIMNDPIDRFDTARIGRSVHEKQALALETRTLNVAWFGVGDNPRFSVGLSDLVAFGSELRRLEVHGFSVQLTILTNDRSLTPDGLELLSRLPVPYRLEIWSEQAEHRLLDASLIAFLPVNTQNFSRVKSLNRAISALSRGAQILSVGHDLYKPLKDYLYYDPEQLITDLEHGILKVRPDTLRNLADQIHYWGNASVEAGRLVDFLSMLPWRAPMPQRKLAMLNGYTSPGRVHKLAQQLGAFSIALPFTEGNMNYDLSFEPTIGPRHLYLRLSKRAAAAIPDKFADCAFGSGDEVSSKGIIVEAPETVIARLTAAKTNSLEKVATLYEPIAQDTANIVSALLQVDDILISEIADPLYARPVGQEAIDIEPVNVAKLERVLIVANGEIPSLDIFWRTPLAPFVSQARLRTLILDDRKLRATMGREWAKEKKWDTIQTRLDAFAPTVIVFCRYSGPLAARYMKYAKNKGIASIFQIDDDLFNIPQTIGPEKYAYHTDPVRMNAIRSLMNDADLIYASTKTLAESLSQNGSSSKAIWTGEISAAANIHHFPVKGKKVGKIGFMGGGDHACDLEEIAPAIAIILDRHPHIRFELFSGIQIPGMLQRFGDRVSRIEPVSDHAAFRSIFNNLDWDIGLCPLERTPFNASKAVLKWVEYTSVAMATIASRGTAYDECSSDGCGILCDDPAEWVDVMESLISDNDRCYNQVVQAQNKLRDHYSPFILQQQTKSVIESVIGRPLVKPMEFLP